MSTEEKSLTCGYFYHSCARFLGGKESGMKQISKVVRYVMVSGLLLVVLGAVPVAAAPCDVPSSAYPTIQAAVDDATCVIINVAAGTYTEHVAIDHNVMIRGE